MVSWIIRVVKLGLEISFYMTVTFQEQDWTPLDEAIFAFQNLTDHSQLVIFDSG